MLAINVLLAPKGRRFILDPWPFGIDFGERCSADPRHYRKVDDRSLKVDDEFWQNPAGFRHGRIKMVRHDRNGGMHNRSVEKR
jgi:hypothetical protein